MMKQATVDGQQVEMYSWDNGRTWCSDPKAILAFWRRRKAILDTRLSEAELRWIDLIKEPDHVADLDAVKYAMKWGN